MKGILKHDGDAWYVEYQEESTSSLSTGTPSKFALRSDNIERIVNGTWEAVEGKRVRFEVTSLPLPPYYEVDLDRSDMAANPFHPRLSTTPYQPKKMKTRYIYKVHFGESSRNIIADSMRQDSEVYYFYNHVKLGGYVDQYTPIYDKEVIAQFPILKTAIYEIKKFEVEDI